jgi:hypothetical protein
VAAALSTFPNSHSWRWKTRRFADNIAMVLGGLLLTTKRASIDWNIVVLVPLRR